VRYINSQSEIKIFLIIFLILVVFINAHEIKFQNYIIKVASSSNDALMGFLQIKIHKLT